MLALLVDKIYIGLIVGIDPIEHTSPDSSVSMVTGLQRGR
jgi:hypothetical protein